MIKNLMICYIVGVILFLNVLVVYFIINTIISIFKEIKLKDFNAGNTASGRFKSNTSNFVEVKPDDFNFDNRFCKQCKYLYLCKKDKVCSFYNCKENFIKIPCENCVKFEICTKEDFNALKSCNCPDFVSIINKGV